MKLNVQGLARRSPSLMRAIKPSPGNKVVSIDLCFPPEVEYLTPEGWVGVLDLKRGQKVWSVNRNTRIGKFETPSRKIKKHYSGRMWNYGTEYGHLPVTEGHRLLFAGKRRPIDRLAGEPMPKRAHMYTTSTSGLTTNISETLLSIAMAVLRYGIVDESGYSIRIEDATHRKEFTQLLGRRGVERGGWEKWASVLSSPLIRGFNLDLSFVGSNQVEAVYRLYTYWLKGVHLTDQQADQFQAYFSRSGITCVMYGHPGTRTLSLSRAPIHPIQYGIPLVYSGTVACVTVSNSYLLVRHSGACFIVGNCAGEPSITAHFSGDANYKYAVNDGVGVPPYYDDTGLLKIDDIYLTVMSKSPIGKAEMRELFDMKFNGLTFSEQWIKDKEVPLAIIKPMRTLLKGWGLGLSYGMGAASLVNHSYAAGYVLSPQDSKAFHHVFWTTFSGVRDFARRLSKIVKKQGYLINPFGYRCTPEPHKAFNAFIQSSVSGLINVLCMKLFTIAPYARLITIIHDELLVEVPEELVHRLQEDLIAAVKSLNDDLGWSIAIRTGFVVGNDWYEAK